VLPAVDVGAVGDADDVHEHLVVVDRVQGGQPEVAESVDTPMSTRGSGAGTAVPADRLGTTT
jgi:hypothetical protein